MKSKSFVLAGLFSSVTAVSGAHAQQKFETPEAAAIALVEAVRAADRKNVNAILGPGGMEITSSGDETQDSTARQLFLMAYDRTHQIKQVDDGKALLSVGAQAFILPIPIVKRDQNWQFDAAAGKEEILYRRIGRNELSAIQVSLAYVDAQHDYSDVVRASGAPAAYAQRFFSRPGKKDGLYWPASSDSPPSPIGEFVAQATMEGYRTGGTPQPFHGYYYKILTQQGSTAPGGAHNYIVNGNMIGGFALVAFPAEYGNSGVMTFVVNHTGTIFQKDLGAHTQLVADRMTSFSPDHTWAKVDSSDMVPE